MAPGKRLRHRAQFRLIVSKKQIVFFFALILFLMPPFFGLSEDTRTRDTRTRELLILVPKTTSSIPFFIMTQKNLIEGVEIKAETFINHPQALIRLLRGEADLLFTGTSVGWENRLDGGPLVLVNTGIWGVSYLIGKDQNIKEFSDLREKKIALPFPRAPLDVQTRYILKKAGIDPEKDVHIVYSSFAQTIPNLLNDRIDAAPIPEPLATDLVLNKGLYRLIDYKKAWAEATGKSELSPQVSLFATEKFVAAHRKLIVRFVEEWRKASQFMKNSPEASAGYAESLLSLPRPIIATAIENTLSLVPSFEENRRMVIDYYREVEDFLPGRKADLDKGFFFTPQQ